MFGRELTLRMLLGLVVLALAVAPVAAEPRALLTPAGDLLLVEEVIGRRGFASIALRSTLERPSGAISVSYIPGTEDEAFDIDPWLALDPIDGRPVLFWSRHNGTDYDLAVSRHDGQKWSSPARITFAATDEIRPRAFVAPREGFHLVWEVPGRGNAGGTYYALFRSDTGVAVRGPERVPDPDLSLGRGGDDGGKTTYDDPTEGGSDSPGLGKGSDPTDPPPDGDDGTSSSCGENGICRTGGSSLKEGATTGCAEFSLVVVHRGRVCLMTRDDTSWSTRGCYAGSKLAVVKKGLDLRSGSACLR